MNVSELIDVRCPLPRKDNSGKQCNRLAVQVAPGSSGKAYCPRHDATFEFQVDDFTAFSGNIAVEKPLQSDQIANPEHP